MTARIKIHYCTGCRFVVRATWIAQELLFTFGERLTEVALVPGNGGIFRVELNDELLFDRKDHDRFPDPKELRQMIRDRIDPDMSLGHSEPKGA